MGIFTIDKNDTVLKQIDGDNESLIKKEKWAEFNTTILGLGDLSEPSKVMSAISAVFDLEGFTYFCKQIDPQLSTPVFLNQFLNWFFQKIKDETQNKEHIEGIEIWHNLPILTKFLGDGILVIWGAEGLGLIEKNNIIVSCRDICEKYVEEFYPIIKRKVTDAPKKLRCGIAQGNIQSVGNGNDFVGPCINFASRLQKMEGISVAFCDRGFIAEENMSKSNFSDWLLKKVVVRGIGDTELIYILKSDYLKMTPQEKEKFTEP